MNAAVEGNGGSGANWKDSYKTAQMITFPDLFHICGNHVGQLVQDLARGVGCPEEFIFMPLLSCCSALMGHCSSIRVHPGWSEPPILWVMVGADGGMRKSAAMRQVLMPFLYASRYREKSNPNLSFLENLDVKESMTPFPLAYNGALDMHQLQSLLTKARGRVLHLTERLEDSHRQLGMHALHPDSLAKARGQLEDLYETLAGSLAAPLPSNPAHSDGKQAKESRAPSPSLSQVVSYTQCGFASPEYVVNLTVRAPAWLSGRFLVTCPPMEEGDVALFTMPGEAVGGGGDDDIACEEPRTKRVKRDQKIKMTLADVYLHVDQAHHQRGGVRCYTFSPEAVQELKRFHEEEWCTIVKQLGGGEQGGIAGKSIGQIVRLAGVLKALRDAGDSYHSQGMENGDSHGAESEGQSSTRQTDVVITGEDANRAVELGKYFLEQKLSMTFMVSTGFFQRRASSSQPSLESGLQPLTPQPQGSQQGFMPALDPVNSLYGFPKLANFLPSPGSMSLGVNGGAGNSGHSGQQATTALSHSQSQAQHQMPHASFTSPSAHSPHQSHPNAHLPSFPFSMPGGGGINSILNSMTGGARASSSSNNNNNFHNNHYVPLPNSSSTPSPSIPASSSSSVHFPVSSSSASASVNSFPSPAEIDVSQLPATWIPTTPEEELAEMSQAAEFAQLEPAQFVAVHARRVKRLLECFDDGCGVSATTAAQKSIAPPVRVAGTNNRHPAWASALFFQKVADLGLGIAEQVRHPTNGRVYWRFRRKAMTDLTEKNCQLLHYLRIDMMRYARLGQPTLHMPSIELDLVAPTAMAVAAADASLDEEASNSASSKGNNSPLVGEPEIKKEVI